MFIHKMGWFFQDVMYPSLTWRRETEEPTIFLTFDDGPIPELTPFILKTLEKYDAKATFFCVGDNIRKHPSILEQTLKAGHSIGNHTFNHLNGWNTTTNLYVENVFKCQEWMEKYMGNISDKLFRPPNGRISKAQIKALKSEFEIIMWEVLSGDYSSAISKEVCLQKSISHAKNGSIIVFHDNTKAKNNLYHTLPLFMEHFHQKGFQFKSLNLGN
ncbi:polysaccharide deacetylase family protein [Flammeovirgaceae bacterium SG7u.111]|nr:polysaccharide deacetylase family protein [Flammeovirgaceae bacterium SG7u.132]WPO33196.1 polysaccharide deacetylase family protein [Flammeovirgaceae bacterium SG7u.111]